MIFFILSILMYWLQSYGNKKFCQKIGESSFKTSLIQNAICCLSASAVLFLSGGINIASEKIFFVSLLFGITYLGTVFLLVCSLMSGPVGLSTLMCNIGMFIAAFYGMVRFKDPFTTTIGAGFVCMLLAVILATPEKENLSNGGLKWFCFALGCGVCNGIMASIKREAVEISPTEIKSVLTLGFLFAGLFAALLAFIPKTNRSLSLKVAKSRSIIFVGLLTGVATSLANLFQMQSLITLPSTVVYPLTSGILVVSLWLASLVIYKETTAKPRNILSVVLCVGAIVLANL